MSDAPTPTPDPQAIARARAIKTLEAEKTAIVRTIEQKLARLAILNEQLAALQK